MRCANIESLLVNARTAQHELEIPTHPLEGRPVAAMTILGHYTSCLKVVCSGGPEAPHFHLGQCLQSKLFVGGEVVGWTCRLW